MAGPTTGGEGPAEPGPVIRDRRRLDPQTGQVRERYGAGGAPKPKGKHVSNGAPDAGSKSRGAAAGKGNGAGSTGAEAAEAKGPEAPAETEPTAAEAADEATGKHAEPEAAADEGEAAGATSGEPAGEADPEPVAKPDPGAPAPDAAAQAVAAAEAAAAAALASAGSPATGDVSAELVQARAEAEERLGDLQRLQAEYVNYRRRVERDRTVARDFAVAGVLETLLPVLDDVHLARQHGDLEGGPFAAIAEKLEAVLARHGLERYGEPGEEFDPSIHEALMHTEAELAEGTTVTTVVQVLQPGYKAGDRVLRPARVAVADPPA